MSPERSTHSDDAVDHTEYASAVREAAATYREARDAVEEYGRDRLTDTREAYKRATSLLRQFDDKATGTGAEEFVRMAQIRASFAEHVESLDEDLPGREAFERAHDAIDKRRLAESDFDRARDELDPVASLVDRLDRYEDARESLKRARQDAVERCDTLEERIEEFERLIDHHEAEADVDLAPLRQPIETYNDAVQSAFQERRTDGSACALFALVERAQSYPLVPMEQPPEELRTFVETTPAGEESVTQLLEYADFSRSKLSHYVEDADRLKRRVSTQRTYLERLDADPLTIGWPPPTVDRLPWRTRAVRAVAAPLLDESAVAALRELEALARDRDRYQRLRTAAAADAELTATERERLESGAVEADLAAAREELSTIETALSEAPAVKSDGMN